MIPSNGRPLPPPTTPRHTFAAGWNTRCRGLPFDKGESEDWRIGWKAADVVDTAFRWEFNKNIDYTYHRASAAE